MLSLCGTSLTDNQINLVLYDNDVLEFHDLDGGQMFRGLGLWAGLVTRYQQKGRVHDSCTCKHSSHQHVVPWAIDERDVSNQ